MRILIIDDGAAGHALVRSCMKIPRGEVYIYPGNAGIWNAHLLDCPVYPTKDGRIGSKLISALAGAAKAAQMDLTIVRARQYLPSGIVDAFRKQGLRIFGPKKKDARIESSKEFMKELANRAGIPTAFYRACDNPIQVWQFVKDTKWDKYVFKDSNALDGHSVWVVANKDTNDIAAEFFEFRKTLIVEEFLEGPEISAFAFFHRGKYKFWAYAHDWKHIFDGNLGPFGGSSGSAFDPKMDQGLIDEICAKVFSPLAPHIPGYTGLVFAGLKLTKDGVKLLELNAGFGDSETQVILACLESNFVEMIDMATDGRLDEINIAWSDDVALDVVLMPYGYPRTVFTGFKIKGIEIAERVPGVEILFAGVDGSRESGYTTKTNRTLNVLAKGPNFGFAASRAYQAVSFIEFPGMHYRRDIGKELGIQIPG